MWRWVRLAAVGLLVLSIAGFIGTLVWHGFGGDSDKYGAIGIPGQGTVTLPAGEVEVHFAVEQATNGGGGSLNVPDLSFSLTSPQGAVDPTVSEDIGGTVTINSSSHVRVWTMQVVDPGVYSVTTDGDVQGYISPRLTFGQASPVPAWPAGAFAALFVVAIGLLIVSAVAGRPDRQVPGLAAGSPTSVTTGSTTGGPPYGGPPGTLTTTTPDQELARLAELQKLTDLHTSGTLSDAEYDAARQRLG